MIMKYLSFIYVSLFLSACLVSCGGGDDDNAGGDEPPRAQAEISVSDDVVGAFQVVLLSVNYITDNPNYLVTWYADGEKLNSIPKSEFNIDWKPLSVGSHLIEVAITDRDKVMKYQKSIEVVETELGDAIIGDSKAKIARTLGTDETSDVITYHQSYTTTYKYYFAQDKLRKIYYEYDVALTPRKETDYMMPITTFSAAFNRYKNKYGEPTYENYTQLETSRSKIVEYGGHIYSGGMHIQAIFQSSTRMAEIYVGPHKGGMGFTYTETLQDK